MKRLFRMNFCTALRIAAVSLAVGSVAQSATTGAVLHAQQQRPAQQAAPAPAADAPDAAHGAVAAPFGIVAYPDRPKAPQATLDRGKAAYSVNCAFCHGSDAGGGSIGPNLLRSEVVLQDKSGEMILPIVHGARAERGMPRIDISDVQVGDIAEWLHSLKTGGNMKSTEKINIVVGSAPQGQIAFGRLCASCHSVSGDLKGFAGKFPDPRAMQQAWIMPGVGGRGAAAVALSVPPASATVTLASGKAVTGKLEAVDDFYVAVTTNDGVLHRYTRTNGLPKVDLHDPLEAHRALLRKYDDKDIHDITAYLVSLK